MRPNKQKHQSLEERNIYCRDKWENWLLMSKNPELPRNWQNSLKGKVREGHLMWRVDSLDKTLMLGGIGGRRRRGRQRMRWLDGITDSMDMSLSKLRVLDRKAWRAVIHGVTKSRTRLSDWTELNWNEGRGIFNYWKPLGPRILCSYSCPHRSGNNVPVNFQQEKYYSLFCNFVSLCEWKRAIPLKGQNPERALLYISGHWQNS